VNWALNFSSTATRSQRRRCKLRLRRHPASFGNRPFGYHRRYTKRLKTQARIDTNLTIANAPDLACVRRNSASEHTATTVNIDKLAVRTSVRTASIIAVVALIQSLTFLIIPLASPLWTRPLPTTVKCGQTVMHCDSAAV